MRCIEPEGHAIANVVSPDEDIQLLTQVTGCVDECWLKRAAILGPFKLLALADAKTDGSISLPVDERPGLY